ncbi:MAG: hypothetical protein GY738_08185 [Pseudoalteromonas sp.]|nr:hypothetical protein [Pseudoalteromonas sp.]
MALVNKCNLLCHDDRHYDSKERCYYEQPEFAVISWKHNWIYCLRCGFSANNEHDFAIHRPVNESFDDFMTKDSAKRGVGSMGKSAGGA